MDTLTTKMTYPCKPATEAEFSEAFWRTVDGSPIANKQLRQIICNISEEQLPIGSLKMLWVIGDSDKFCNEALQRAQLNSGIYIDHSGKQILLIHQEDSAIQAFISRFGDQLITLNQSFTSIQSLDLSALTSLKQFYMQNDERLTTVSGLEHLKQLEKLHIHSCANLTCLKGLKGLTQLIELNLSDCRSLSYLFGLENLTQLMELNITRCKSLKGLADLKRLTKIKKLALSECSSLSQLTGLEKLTLLEELRIHECYSLEAIPDLQNQILLTELVITGCSNLTQLTGLENLTQLIRLSLSECRNLAHLAGLNNLVLLRQLNLSGCSSLIQLPGLDNLTLLKELSLAKCSKLTQLPALDHLTQMTELSLSGCSSLNVLPDGIRKMTSLRRLVLRNLKLRELPEWLPDIAERFSMEQAGWKRGKNRAVIYLYNTTVEGINDMSIFEQPYEMVVKWFEERKLGRTQPLNEVKVVFLGDGEAGKSHTIARLMNNGGDPDEEFFDGRSTPGIIIRNKEYDLGDRKIQIHYWDFGGQEIMHSMHRIFLTSRTMYVILLNARDDTQGDRARYWLHNVKSFAPDAPVLLALNKIDQNENASVDEVDLRGRYGKLTRVIKLSAKEFTQDEFNKCFTEILLEEIKDTGFLDARWPIAWTQVKQKLENMSTHYILGDAYQTICKECQVDDNQNNLLHWFNDLGISFCCCDKDDYALEEYVILRPDWITNALYIILFNKLEGSRNGLIPHASIHRIIRSAHSTPTIRCTLPQARYNTGDVQYVLGVMRKFNLSFQYGTDHEFIPMLCQQNSTIDIQYYHKDEDILEFNMEFDYLPNNLLHRLMVERHQELDMDNVWRNGAKFMLTDTGLSAVVTIDDNVLHFFIRNDGNLHLPNTYLAILKANVDRIVQKMGIKEPECKLVYKVHGKRAIFSYNRLLKMHARGRIEEYCEDLDEDFLIMDILNQAAPAASEDLNALLDSMISAGLHLQGNINFRGWDENGRNSVVRDSLEDKGYIVLDQNLRGTSETGKSYGELDLLIQREPNRPWVLCEALIAGGYTHKWNEHLNKLLNEYNPHGLPYLVLLTYLDCPKSKFQSIWTKYKQHIREDDPKNFIRIPETFLVDVHSEYEYIKSARCSYQRDGYVPVVYHVFVQMDPKEVKE